MTIFIRRRPQLLIGLFLLPAPQQSMTLNRGGISSSVAVTCQSELRLPAAAIARAVRRRRDHHASAFKVVRKWLAHRPSALGRTRPVAFSSPSPSPEGLKLISWPRTMFGKKNRSETDRGTSRSDFSRQGSQISNLPYPSKLDLQLGASIHLFTSECPRIDS